MKCKLCDKEIKIEETAYQIYANEKPGEMSIRATLCGDCYKKIFKE